MKIYNFLEKNNLNALSQPEKAKLLCYFLYKEKQIEKFKMIDIQNIFIEAGYSVPNASRLKISITTGKNKFFKADLSFIPAVLQKLDNEIGQQWQDFATIESHNELLDEDKFCNKRSFLTKLIKQINSSYSHNCYDACAVLMRRLLEVTLILSYQNLGIDNEIKTNDGSYLMLEKIVKDAKNNSMLKLSRLKNDLDNIREFGNFSAHSITYLATKKDIDDIKLKYRAILEELYNKSGLL